MSSEEKELTLVGGSPWGFRFQGGADTPVPLRVTKVNPGSKAAKGGLKDGHVIRGINGTPTSGMTNRDAHAAIKDSPNTLLLTVASPVTESSPETPSPNEDPSVFATIKPRYYHSSVTVSHNPRPCDDEEDQRNGSRTVEVEESTVEIEESTVEESTVEVVGSAPCSSPSSRIDGVTSVEEREVAVRAPVSPDANQSSPSRPKDPQGSTVLEGPAFKANSSTKPSVWNPGGEEDRAVAKEGGTGTDSSPPTAATPATPATPVWQPASSPGIPQRKEFRPIAFDASQLASQELEQEDKEERNEESTTRRVEERSTMISESHQKQQQQQQHYSSNGHLGSDSSLPKYTNPTITLLQKARAGELPKGAMYIDHKMSAKESSSSPATSSLSSSLKSSAISPDHVIRKSEASSKKSDGIGLATQVNTSIPLKAGAKEEDQHAWYKKMFDTLHKQKYPSDEYIHVRYRQRGRYPWEGMSGGSDYQSEPELDSRAGVGMSEASKYATLDRRRPRYPFNKSVEPASARYSSDIYKNQPGKIENYIPGHSSISEKEARMWLDSLFEEIDSTAKKALQIAAEYKTGTRHNPPPPQSHLSQALWKELAGYESDSTLVFRRKEDLSSSQEVEPGQQKLWYREVQRGGEVPLTGLRKPAPEKPAEPLIGPIPTPKSQSFGSLPSDCRPFDRAASPHKYNEGQVNIHYRTPVRALEKEFIPEDELRRRQASQMRRLYEEERHRKFLQELQDQEMRRHQDFLSPTQKTQLIPLDRYDNLFDDSRPRSRDRDRLTPDSKTIGRALHDFIAQSSRELSIRKGDLVYIRRQVDPNWYEGEHNAMHGIFPVSYVELIPYDEATSGTTAKRVAEGQARARYHFQAHTPLELPLIKGELVALTRRVDANWWEGRIGSKRGIFPDSYVEILVPPGVERHGTSVTKPVASPAAHSLIMNGSVATPAPAPPPSQRPNDYTYAPAGPRQSGYTGSPSRQLGYSTGSAYRTDSGPGSTSPSRQPGGYMPRSTSPIRQPGGYVPRPTSPTRQPSGYMPRPTSPTRQPSGYVPRSVSPPRHSGHVPRPASPSRYHGNAPRSRTTTSRTYAYARSYGQEPGRPTMHVEVNSEPVPYRALYDYLPVNEDELELREGDVVYVLEKCDDGWYVGTSQRTGLFGTFPGNYVQRL